MGAGRAAGLRPAHGLAQGQEGLRRPLQLLADDRHHLPRLPGLPRRRPAADAAHARPVRLPAAQDSEGASGTGEAGECSFRPQIAGGIQRNPGQARLEA